MSYYEHLGVAPSAHRDDIRLAYREKARKAHPDAHGGIPSNEMLKINEAWRVLSDPGRRAAYDASLRDAGPPSLAARRMDATTPPPPRRQPDTTPARFPWRFMSVMAVFGIGFVLVNAALTNPATPSTPDNVLQIGSCVNIDATQDAAETDCGQANDGVVELLVPFDSTCPLDLESHRDRQGMGLACVRRELNG